MIAIVLLSALGSLGLGVVGGILARQAAGRIIVYGGSLVTALVVLTVAVWQVALGIMRPPVLTLPLGLPGVGMHFEIDDLSAAFLAIVNLGAALASLYALGYGKHESEPLRVLPFYPVFLAAMNLVVVAADAYGVLLFWEMMSLASWALVIAHHDETETRRAGYVYLLMASAGTLALLLAFGLLAGPDGHYTFAAMRQAQPVAWGGAVVMLLTLIGAGSKAGLMPLHVWLPRAHPAAPSQISALMSGVMTKVAIYVFIRIVFCLAGPVVWWWGVIVLAIGGITAVLGVLQALMEDDIKVILAYSTIENIGLIFVGLGLALAFRADGMAIAAALALTAALFHAFNHMLFKSALFFGAGTIQHATGERSLAKLGGLMHRMKVSAVPMLIAAMAIAALPPLNGFASEWLLLQAILLSPALPQFGLKLAVPAVGALVALAAAFAAACFVRFYGIAYLGRPRSAAALAAQETDGFSRAAMIVLAGLCLVFGVLPALALRLISPAVQGVVGAHVALGHGLSWLTLQPVVARHSSYNPVLILIFIGTCASLAAVALHRFATRTVRRTTAWACGFTPADRSMSSFEPSVQDEPGTQYSPSGFSQPIRRVFASVLFRVRDDVTMPPPGSTAPARLVVWITDPIWNGAYLSLAAFVEWAAERTNRLQFLTIRRYLGFVFITLVLLLCWIALWG